MTYFVPGKSSHTFPATDLHVTDGAGVNGVLAVIDTEGDEATSQVTPAHQHKQSDITCCSSSSCFQHSATFF